MISRVRSLGLQGISGYEVQVECCITGGLPAFEVVGLPDAAVRESRERVRAAIKNCGYKFPVSRITLNLAPAGTKKTGTMYDLPILLGILSAAELVRLPKAPCAFLGELSLEGKLRPVAGVLPMTLQYCFVDALTALGVPHVSMSLSLARKLNMTLWTILLPALGLGAFAAFCAEPIADLCAGILSTVAFRKTFEPLLSRRSMTGGEIGR